VDLHLHGRPPVQPDDGLELREVELRENRGVWTAGTRGVIVDAFESDATVEIMDEDGRTLDLITVEYEALSLLDQAEQEHLAF
jgi:hypothetical protein